MQGYSTYQYARALEEIGRPRELQNSGGWVIERSIPGFAVRDAMGCYPLFACPRWENLGSDIRALEGELVSLTLVTDPFQTLAPEKLREIFPDLCRPFKEHIVAELGPAWQEVIHAQHRKKATRAAQQVQIDWSDSPRSWAAEWTALYEVLKSRHQIQGIPAFSEASFLRQLETPGILAFRARRNDRTVGMILWYVQDRSAYYHLGAYDEEGYVCHASFALFLHALAHLRERGVRYADLGAGAGMGTPSDQLDGLSRFKRGWGNQSRPVYLCGRILDRPRYNEICHAKLVLTTSYFPAYRAGEFKPKPEGSK